RRAQLELQVTKLDRRGWAIEEGDERAKLALLRCEHARGRARVETGQHLPALIVIPGHPDADATPANDFQPGRAQIAFDRREVVANDPRRELQLRRDRVECGGVAVREQQPSGARLA